MGHTVSRLVNRNITAIEGRTSMRLEPELWEALRELCAREGLTVAALMRQIEHDGRAGGRTSAVRVHLLKYFRAAATEDGHRAAGHQTPPAPSPSAEPFAPVPRSTLHAEG